MANETLRTTAANMINAATEDIAKPGNFTADQLIAACRARAHLAVATALLDVADAIRSDGTGAAVERALDRTTAALSRTGGRV